MRKEAWGTLSKGIWPEVTERALEVREGGWGPSTWELLYERVE